MSDTSRPVGARLNGATGSRAADAESALAVAREHYSRGRVEQAEEICRRLLIERQGQSEAHYLLGLIAQDAGKSEMAAGFIRRAIARRPNRAAYHASLGRILRVDGRLEESTQSLRQAIELEPDRAETYRQLGKTLVASYRFEEALQCCRRAIQLRPDDARARSDLIDALEKLGRLPDVLASRPEYLPLVIVDPSMLADHAFLHLASGRVDEARSLVALGSQHHPSSRELAALASAIECGRVPARPPSTYIVRLFDTYADRFDEQLRRKLEYQAPELLRDAALHVLGPPEARLDVLDLGCGTGLCGPLMRPFARRLVGVDLSEKMLARAGERGVYDELDRADLIEFLGTRPAGFDLLIGADVLIYLGDLGPLFVGAASALRPTGALVVSVEASDEPEYDLQPSGRFAHNANYLRQAAEGAGLTLAELTECQLRFEHGQPVRGYVCVFHKGAADQTV